MKKTKSASTRKSLANLIVFKSFKDVLDHLAQDDIFMDFLELEFVDLDVASKVIFINLKQVIAEICDIQIGYVNDMVDDPETIPEYFFFEKEYFKYDPTGMFAASVYQMFKKSIAGYAAFSKFPDSTALELDLYCTKGGYGTLIFQKYLAIKENFCDDKLFIKSVPRAVLFWYSVGFRFPGITDETKEFLDEMLLESKTKKIRFSDILRNMTTKPKRQWSGFDENILKIKQQYLKDYLYPMIWKGMCINCLINKARFRCGNCLNAEYCGKDCQKEHWDNKSHDC